MNIILIEKLFQRWIVQGRVDDNVYVEIKNAAYDLMDQFTTPFVLENYKETVFGIALEAALRCYLDDAYHQTQEAQEDGELNTAVHTNLLYPYVLFVWVKSDVPYAKQNWDKVKVAVEYALPITAAVAVLLNEHLEE